MKLGITSNANSFFSDQIPSGVHIETNSSTRQGMDIGAYVEWSFFPMLDLLTELHYTQKGELFQISTWSDNIHNISNMSTQSSVSYITIPLLAKYKLHYKIMTPYLEIGPQFDVYISGNSNTAEFDYRAIEVGGILGVGIDAPMGLPAGIEVRLNSTFTDSPRNSELNVLNTSIKHETIEVLAAIQF